MSQTKEGSSGPRILEVEMNCDIGMSVQIQGGDWIKVNPGIRIHVGPGYPDQAMMTTCFQGMFSDLTNQAAEQIDFLVAEVNRKVEAMNGK